MKNTILITGGAGFIGSNLVRFILKNTEDTVINVDKLTYAGNLDSLKEFHNNPRHIFKKVDICDQIEIKKIFETYKPNKVMHLAAESHVDRSIDDPSSFIKTNVFGTYTLLEVAREYYKSNQDFIFHHISTDEVFGDLGANSENFFTEETPYDPSSPYSASKASSDHLVRAWGRTYKLPVVITNCSNNYGPYHFPEKLIPHMILNALHEKPLPVYGDGKQVRDWLFVEDHARALYLVATKGKAFETYNVGGNSERKNIEVVETICEILDELLPKNESYKNLITFVKDRPGHDLRYAIDASKIKKELGWEPQCTFEEGIRKTISWYLENRSWWEDVLSGSYKLGRIGEGLF